MGNAIYSVAQINSARGNLKYNMEKHMRFIKLAAENNCEIIIFPEMSLTGYERELAAQKYFIKDDKRLVCFQDASTKYKITIVLGGPLKLNNKLYIASWIFEPNKQHQIYIKKYLHTGEELYFSSSKHYDPVVKLKDKQMSFSICYDIENDAHIEQVKLKGSNFYGASIFYTKSGIKSGIERLEYIANRYSLAVFMSNYVGTGWELEAGGCSSIWSDKGDLVISADKHSECLLIAQNDNGEWRGSIKKLYLKEISDVLD